MQVLWRPMMALYGQMWVHANNVRWLINLWQWAQYASHLFHLETPLCRKQKTVRPMSFALQRIVKACSPGAAYYHYHPSQISDVWGVGSLHSDYPCTAPALRCKQPGPQYSAWWIDDTFEPGSLDWWTVYTRFYSSDRHSGQVTWIACYDGSVGFNVATSLNVTWIVCVPRIALKLLTDRAVRQTSQPLGREIIARNPCSIWIGDITPELSHGEYHRTVSEWAMGLQREFTKSWLTVDCCTSIPSTLGARQATIS
ncbi:unnamed protein product [Phytophthora fragariaefolia]|uniref:Unnamed protein product n=1 Tax=Phytophthora fragariaefolia TaxID=1490495 RepID=A0A9W7CP22_9STRA|nr:unnamed protein product [Phytophthora fragariaefolia]